MRRMGLTYLTPRVVLYREISSDERTANETAYSSRLVERRAQRPLLMVCYEGLAPVGNNIPIPSR